MKEVTELRIYRKAFQAASGLFEISKSWPKEETYALTDQIRRSSRSVCANLTEAWRKRRYPNHFVSKLSDADAEAAETRTWLRFAVQCGYVDRATFETYDEIYDHLCGGLVRMMTSPDKWCGPSNRTSEPFPPPYEAD